jgi:hypothetical protein
MNFKIKKKITRVNEIKINITMNQMSKNKIPINRKK